MALRLRRGTDAQRLTLDGVALPVPAEGELIYTTDTKKLYVGDGATTGGIAVDVANSTLSVDDLTDVDITTVAPTDGQSLVWNDSDSEFQPGDANISNQSINALQDVDTISNTPTVGQVLKYDGAGWVNGTDVSGGLIDGATYPINITGDVSGSVFGDDSSLIVDGTDGTITTPVITVGTILTDSASPIIVSNNNRVPLQIKSVTTGASGGFPYTDYLSVKGSIASPTSVLANDIVGGWKISAFDAASGDGKPTALMITTLAADGDVTDDFPKSTGELIIGAGAGTYNTYEFGLGGEFKVEGAITPGIYADASARDAAITAPTAGMMVFVTDVTKFQGYTGSTWADLN